MLSFFLITSRAFNTLCNCRIPGVYQSAPLSVLFSLYRYFNLLWCRNNSRIWLMYHNFNKKCPARCSSSHSKQSCSDSRRNRISNRCSRCRQQSQPRASYPLIYLLLFLPLRYAGEKSPDPPCGYAAKGILQERPGAMLQFAFETELLRCT